MLARKVFDDSANRYFQHISFCLKQPIRPTTTGSPATVELIYFIDRNADTNLPKIIPASIQSQTARKVYEGNADAGEHGHWKIVTLEIDSIPADAYQIAKKYWQAHQEYSDVTIYVKHVPSRLCQSVKYEFWFE